MSNIDSSARALPVGARGSAQPEARPWGVWASLALYLLIFEGETRLEELFERATGLPASLGHNVFLQTLYILAIWGAKLAIVVVAVRMTRLPLRAYLGWIRPRLREVTVAITVMAALFALVIYLIDAEGGSAAAAQDYRGALGKGVSPWWYVLAYWPAIFLAPFVEETFFRGFLWRGVQSRLGNFAAFGITTLLFAAMHYNYWARGGEIDPGSVVQYLVVSAIFGSLRWLSGGSTAPMIAHVLNNAGLRIMAIVLSALAP